MSGSHQSSGPQEPAPHHVRMVALIHKYMRDHQLEGLPEAEAIREAAEQLRDGKISSAESMQKVQAVLDAVRARHPIPLGVLKIN